MAEGFSGLTLQEIDDHKDGSWTNVSGGGMQELELEASTDRKGWAVGKSVGLDFIFRLIDIKQ